MPAMAADAAHKPTDTTRNVQTAVNFVTGLAVKDIRRPPQAGRQDVGNAALVVVFLELDALPLEVQAQVAVHVEVEPRARRVHPIRAEAVAVDEVVANSGPHACVRLDVA